MFNEVINYVQKEEILTEEQSKRLSTISSNEAKEELENLHNLPSELVLSQIRVSSDAVSGDLASVYLDNCFKNNKKNNNELLSSIVALSELNLACDYFDIRDDRDYFSALFSEQGEFWLMLFACNRFELISPCYSEIIQGLKDGRISNSLPAPRKPQKLGVLAVEMMAREHKQTVDWDSVNIPVDPFYIRFCDEALLCKDNDVVRSWLIDLCDKHLEWTFVGDEVFDRNRLTGYEIEQSILLVWPFEYQAVKNYRTRHGLTTPDIDHPLLTSPMAIEHMANFQEWNKWAWLDPMIDFVVQNKPELSFLKTLFNSKN